MLPDSAITGTNLKEKHPAPLKDVAVQTIQHRLQKDLKMPARCAAKKPILTEAMKKNWLQFCKKYKELNLRPVAEGDVQRL